MKRYDLDTINIHNAREWFIMLLIEFTEYIDYYSYMELCKMIVY
jgi:hypothetical protein